MKKRLSFVTNSSSSSFIIEKTNTTYNHTKLENKKHKSICESCAAPLKSLYEPCEYCGVIPVLTEENCKEELSKKDTNNNFVGKKKNSSNSLLETTSNPLNMEYGFNLLGPF